VIVVLFITDDLPLGQLVAEGLNPHGLSMSRETPTSWATSSCRAQAVLALVDVATKGVAFAQLVHDMRRRGPIPLIVIAEADDPVAPAGYLDAGADDCIARPVRRDDVVARIRAVLRRTERADAHVRQEGNEDLRIDPSTRSVVTDGNVVPCTPAEYDILECLTRATGRVISRDELSVAACGRPASPLDRSIDVHISRLRRKLRHHGQRIVTVRGAGYMLAGRRGDPVSQS
jgi:two-component system response regulator CpxR